MFVYFLSYYFLFVCFLAYRLLSFCRKFFLISNIIFSNNDKMLTLILFDVIAYFLNTKCYKHEMNSCYPSSPEYSRSSVVLFKARLWIWSDPVFKIRPDPDQVFKIRSDPDQIFNKKVGSGSGFFLPGFGTDIRNLALIYLNK